MLEDGSQSRTVVEEGQSEENVVLRVQRDHQSQLAERAVGREASECLLTMGPASKATHGLPATGDEPTDAMVDPPTEKRGCAMRRAGREGVLGSFCGGESVRQATKRRTSSSCSPVAADHPTGSIRRRTRLPRAARRLEPKRENRRGCPPSSSSVERVRMVSAAFSRRKVRRAEKAHLIVSRRFIRAFVLALIARADTNPDKLTPSVSSSPTQNPTALSHAQITLKRHVKIATFARHDRR